MTVMKTAAGVEISAAVFASTVDLWTFRRLSSQRNFHSLLPREQWTPRPAAFYDIVRADAPCPLFWAFARPPRPEADPRSAQFTRVKPDSIVSDSDAKVEQWLDHGAVLYDAWGRRLQTASGPERLILETELPHLKKLTVQRGKLMNWFVTRQSPSPDVDIDIPKVKRAIAHTMRLLASKADPADGDHPHPDPAFTNAGWPTFQSHPAGKVVSALLAVPGSGGVSRGLQDAGMNFSALVGLPTHASWGYGLGGRSGAIYKDVELLALQPGSDWQHAGSMKGCAQRNRVVQMSAYGLNFAVRRLYAILHGARTRMPGMWHEGGIHVPPDVYASGIDQWHWYESDLSAFDTTVPVAMRSALVGELLHYFPSYSQEILTYDFGEQRPLITPSWSLNPTTLTVASRVGGLATGAKFTSWSGAVYAYSACREALQDQGLTLIEEDPSQGQVHVLEFGDDILLISRVPIDREAWADSHARMGLKAAMIDGDGFLMQHAVIGNAPLASRIMQQTASNEHEPTGPHAEGRSMLGFLARTQGADRLPAFMQRDLANFLSQLDFLSRFRSNDLATMRRSIADDPSVIASIEAALRDAQARTWLTDIYREKNHSASAQAAWDFAVALGLTGQTQNVLSVDAQIADLSARLSTLPTPQRVALAVEGFRAVTASAADGYDWLRAALKIDISGINNKEGHTANDDTE
jgi:hypothetical protein